MDSALALILIRFVIVGSSIYMPGIGSYYDSTNAYYGDDAYWEFSDPSSITAPVIMCTGAENCAKIKLTQDKPIANKSIADIYVDENRVIVSGADVNFNAAIWTQDKSSSVVTETILGESSSVAFSVHASKDGSKIFAAGYNADMLPVLWSIQDGTDPEETLLDMGEYDWGEALQVYYDESHAHAVGFVVDTHSAEYPIYVASYWIDGVNSNLIDESITNGAIATSFFTGDVYK